MNNKAYFHRKKYTVNLGHFKTMNFTDKIRYIEKPYFDVVPKPVRNLNVNIYHFYCIITVPYTLWITTQAFVFKYSEL